MSRFSAVRLAALCIPVLLVSACASKSVNDQAQSDQQAVEYAEADKYQYFDDVLIPKELTIDHDDTFIVESGGGKSGVMALKGYVELNSLINYFTNNMTKDGWQQRVAFKSHRSILIFEKGGRFATIRINDGFKTTVEIWIAPALGASGGGGYSSPSSSAGANDFGAPRKKGFSQ